jgi:pyruvate/2-oxoglutarate dehydrogenase complex dihydrolipoamide acyltransferase (E2) component
MMKDECRELTLPDLGLGDRPIVLNLWFVKERTHLSEGEPVVEVMADGVTIDLPVPIDGILTKKHVAEGEVIAVGQCLATMESD